MRTLFIFCLLISNFNLYAQPDTIVNKYKSLINEPDANFYEIRQAFDAYIESLPIDSINFYIKEFKRFESFWNGRAGSYQTNTPGNFSDLNNLYRSYNNSVVCDDAQYYIDNNIDNWNLIGPVVDPSNPGYLNRLGHVSAVYFVNENQYLIGTNASGIWQTFDGGANWKCVTDDEKFFGIGISSIVKDPTDASGNTFYASTGYNTYGPTYGIGVIKSIDGGESWIIPSNINNQFIISVLFKMAISQNGILYAVSGKNVYSSNDGANSWTDISPTINNTSNFILNTNQEWVDVDIVPDGTGSKLFIASRDFGNAGGGAQVLLSNNGGSNWSNISNNLLGWLDPNYLISDPDFEQSTPSTSTFFPVWQNTTGNWSPMILSGSNVGATIPTPTGNILQRSFPLFARDGSQFIFDAFKPANTQLKIEFVNPVSGVTYLAFESTFEIFDQSISNLTIPFLPSSSNSDDKPTKLVFTAFSNVNYGNTTELWIDNIRLYPFVINKSERIAVSCPNTNTAWICFRDHNTGDESGHINSFDLSTENVSHYFTFSNDEHNGYTNLNGQKMEFEASPFRNDVFYYGGVNLIKLENFIEFDIHRDYPNPNALHDDIRALNIIDINGTQERLLIGTDGGVVFSEDGGALWINKNGKLPITQFYGLDIEENNPDLIVSGALDNGSFTLSEGNSIAIGFDGGNSKIQNGIIYYQSNEKIENSDNSNFISLLDWGLNMPIEVTNEHIPTVFIGGVSSLYRSDAYLNSPIQYQLNNETTTAIGIHPTNPNLIYLAKGNLTYGGDITTPKIYSSTNKGIIWTPIPEPLSTDGSSIYKYFTISDFTFDPDNENRVWCSIKGNCSAVNDIHSRVFYSNDYGQTWVDLSINNGLPPFSVNTITRQNGSDDIIYVGTDIGVFYCENCNDPQTAVWNCFNNELPPCIITDLKINYCQNKLYASTFGRGIWNADIIKTERKVSSNTTWTQPVKLFGDLRITNGATLVVNSTIDIPENCKIIVENNAHLYLNGGTLTNSCGSMWQGVEVWGSATATQPVGQGRFTALNNSLVENSKNGVYAYKIDAITGLADMNTTGGVIRCFNSTFKNNKTAVKLLPYSGYTFGNLSRFVNVNFITDNELNDENELPSEQALLIGVRNVNFYGCTFENSRTQGSFPLSDRGTGIRSFSSIFKVLPNGNDQSEFNELYRGINTSTGNLFNTFLVHKAKFNNNTRGILASGINYATILENEFIVPDLQSLEAPYGIYLNFCSDYEVEENTFTSPTGNLNAGIGVFHSGDDPNRIYNNAFDKMYVGQLLMDDNRNTTTGAGLQVLCNENTNNGFDAALTSQGEIGFNQGAPLLQNSPAGNVFSHNCIGGDNDYFAQSTLNTFTYYSHSNIPPICYTVSDISLLLTPFNYDALNREASCPSELSINTSPIIHRSLFGYFDDLYAERILLIDGGDLQTVLNYLNSNNSPGQIKDYLMGLSPYLSDKVLMKIIDKNLPAGHIKQILLANSPLSAEVLDYFMQTSYPLGIINEVENAQTGISERSKLYAELAYYDSEKNKAAGDYIRYYLLVDTTATAKDSIKLMLAQSGIPDALCKKAAFDIHSGDFASASTHVGDLNAIDPEDAFCKLLNVLLELEQTIEKCFSITPPQKEKLEAIAADHSKEVCKNAQALLELVYNLSFPEVIEFPIENRSQFDSDETKNEVIEMDNFRIFPNPASDYIYIEMDDETFESGQISFSVYDIIGKKLLFTQARSQWESLDISKIASGTYIISIDINGETVGKFKFIKE